MTYRAWRVWQRNRDSHLRLWRTELWPMFVEPILVLLAFGAGLGAFVTPIAGESYLQFIAPGMLAQTVVWTVGFECSYGTYIRMDRQRTFDAIMATPVGVADIVAGEILWGATRGLIAVFPVLLVIGLLGLVPSPWALLTLPLAVLGGLAIASLTMIFTATVPSISAFNYFITLVLTPMMLFSGIFFPLAALPGWLQTAAWFLPLRHLAEPMRAAVRGTFAAANLGDLLWLIVVGALLFWLALALMHRRLVR